MAWRLSPHRARLLWAATQVTGRFSTAASGWLADKLWFTPWPVPVSERAKARQEGWLSDTTPVSFSTRYGRLKGFSKGKGPVVLLIHGWGDTAATLGAFIDPLVASGHRVIGFDMPGHGGSDYVEPNAYVFAEAVLDVANEIGDVRAMIAHSMGTYGALSAIKSGVEAESVVVIAPPPTLDGVLEIFSRMLKLPRKATQGLHSRIERRFGPIVWSELEPQRMIEGVGSRALLVHDEDDDQTPFATSQRLARAWGSATFLPTKGLGHARVLRDEAVIGAVTDFIGKVRSETGAPVKEYATR